MAKRQLLFPALILLLAALVRLAYLDIKPPHFDEGINGWFCDQMVKTGYYAYDPTNYHGPFHFYVLLVFLKLFGRNLWALRLPVVLASLLTVFWIFLFQKTEQSVTGRRRESQTEPRDGFAIEATVFEIRVGDFAFRTFVQLTGEKCGGFAVHFHQRGALLVFLALCG